MTTKSWTLWQVIKEQMDNCPLPLQNNKLNVKNHLAAIKDYGLGPADPRQSNAPFWQDKAKRWKTTEGDARGRLCANCEHYMNTSLIEECIVNGPAMSLKASALPLSPKWADIESRPVAYCTLLDITCSPTRTCNEQEMGGPIDDVKEAALKLAKAVRDSGMDLEEIDLLKDSTED